MISASSSVATSTSKTATTTAKTVVTTAKDKKKGRLLFEKLGVAFKK